MKYQKPIKCFAIALVVLSLCGCGLKPFKFPIYQGNLLSNKQVAQVRQGHTREQVQYILGTPILQDVFNPDEMHYVYYEKQAHQPAVKRKLVLTLQHNRVVRIEQQGFSVASNV